MEVKVFDINGKETAKKIELNDSIFNIEPNDHAIYLDVKQHLENRRSGTHKSKERAEVSRTTKKYKKQKGTGGARSGSLKSHLYKGGGTAFGPRPKDYGFKLNKKIKRLARKSALTYKAKEDNIIVLENFFFDEPKTKNYIEILKNMNLLDKKTLLVLSESNKSLYLSARNINSSKVIVSELNTYEFLDSKKIIITESSVEKIENILSN